MSEETKKCPSCCEFVKAEAIKCRYCAYFFSNNIFNKRHPHFGPTLVGLSIFIVIFGLFALLPVIFIDEGRAKDKRLAFDRSKNEIVIQDDKISHRTPSVGIIGEIKNNGASNWYSVEVKAKLLSKTGETVNVLEKQIYGLRAGEVKTFKIGSCCGDKADPVKFDKYEIFVEDAILNRW